MKEEGYTRCQGGLLFDNVGGNCVWADQVTCDPEGDDLGLLVAASAEGGTNTGDGVGDDSEATTTTTGGGKRTYSKPMKSVTENPRYQGPATAANNDQQSSSSSSSHLGGSDWGGYWHNGKWIDDTKTTTTTSNGNEEWDKVQILSWTNTDIVDFPLPQLQPYDLAQSSTTMLEETTVPKEFISQEGWSSQSRSSPSSSSSTTYHSSGSSSGEGRSNGNKVIGYYANWQWYSNQERPTPQNMQFTKVDRVNFAFFQTNDIGEVWGSDLWADAAILL